MKRETKERLIEFLRTVNEEGLLKIVIFPIVFFMVLDIWTTYQGVCVYGGIELNNVAIAAVYAFGFIGASAVYFLAYVFFGLLFCRWLLREKNKYFKMFLIAIFAVYVMQHMAVILANFSTLLYQITGTPPVIVNPAPSAEHISSFNRELFCRLFP